jgi:hypothetical protein
MLHSDSKKQAIKRNNETTREIVILTKYSKYLRIVIKFVGIYLRLESLEVDFEIKIKMPLIH